MSLSLMRKLDSKSETLEEKSTSPLDIEYTDINITIEDIITFIHDSRKNKIFTENVYFRKKSIIAPI